MGYYNLPPTSYAQELTDFEKLLRNLPVECAIPALDLLETLSRNVIQNPSEEKYRRVRTTNEKLIALFGVPGTVDVMENMGWQFDGEFMTLPKDVHLDFQAHVVKILEAKSHFGKQKELVARSAKIAADPGKAELLKQLEIDRRERSAAAGLPIAVSRVEKGVAVAEAATVPVTVSRPPEAAIDPVTASRPPPATESASVGGAVAVPASGTANTASGAARPKSAFDFERRGNIEEAKKEGELSLQDIRALQREKFKEFQADPNARRTEAYHRPPSVADGASAEAGWFDWLWGSGGGGSSSGGGGGGGGNRRDRPAPGGPRMKTMKDLPPPVRRGGG